MRSVPKLRTMFCFLMGVLFFAAVSSPCVLAADEDAKKNAGPPPVPVEVGAVSERTVSDQIRLIGTTEAIAVSTVAAEVSGLVEAFPVKAGDFMKKGQLLVRMRDTEFKLRLKSYVAERERVRANLENAEKELERVEKLRITNSIAETRYDAALYGYRALSKAFLRSQAEIDLLEYQIRQKKVFTPFSGFIIDEHTQVGEWIQPGGPVVTLIDMENVLITVDVPERFAVNIPQDSDVQVLIPSISGKRRAGTIYAMLFQGDPNARTLPIRVKVENPRHRIRAGMEAEVTFNLAGSQNRLLVPKDAVVTAGKDRMVFAVHGGKALPVNVEILGYYGGDVAVAGNLEPGAKVVIRGNERLRPGQSVTILN